MPRDRSSRSRPARRPLSAILWFLLALVLAGIGFDRAFDRWYTGLEPARRNPLFRRAWVEHVRGARPRAEGERLIVLISNSQGYGREVSDEETYANRLEQQLAGPNGRVRVLNWSLPGGSAPEFTVLAAAAQRLDPDVVLLVSSAANFNRTLLHPGESERASRIWSSDCRGLVAFHDVRARIPGAWQERYLGLVARFDLALGRRVRAWRYRDLPVACWMRSEDWHAFERDPGEETWFFGPTLPGPLHGMGMRAEVSWELVDEVVAALGPARVRAVFVAMPRHSIQDPLDHSSLARIGQRFEAAGSRFVDLSTALPDDAFVSTTHFTAAGHARMAQLLASHLEP